MMRKKMKVVNPTTDSITRGLRHLRVSPLNVAPPRKPRPSNLSLEEPISELNEMVERIGNIDLSPALEPTIEPQPSVSAESRDQDSIQPQEKVDYEGSDSSSMMDQSVDSERVHVTLFSTLALMVNDGNVFISIRGMLDSSSQCHVITERCCRKLNLPLSECESEVIGLGGKPQKVLGKTLLNFSPYFNCRRVFKVEVLVINRICSRTPATRVDPSIREQMGFFKLADPNFDIPAPIDLLIGSTLFPILIKGVPSFFITESCRAVQTYLGWVVTGRVPVAEFHPKKARMESPEEPSDSSRGKEQYFCNVFPPEYLNSV